MTTERLDPLDPFSEVVDERRRWTPDWYGWLTKLVGIVAAGGSGPPPTTADPLYLSHGLGIDASNPDIRGDPNNHRALDVTVNTDSSTTNPGFTDENAMQIMLNAQHGGPYTHGNGVTDSKKTFIPLLIMANYKASGQRFAQVTTVNGYGMGDCAIYGNLNVNYASGPVGGDEGQGWGLVSLLQQQNFRSLEQIVSIPPQATINTTTTQPIVASQNQQTVNVVSTAGVVVDQWVVIEQQVANGAPNLEAVQVKALTATSITGVFLCNHPTVGTTVTPALVLQLTGDNGFGQDRVLVNLSDLSGMSYSTGLVTGISGGAFTGDASTNWSEGMVGGYSQNIGAIALQADDYQGTPYSPGNILKSWYQIIGVSGPHGLGIHRFTVAAASGYKGNGPGSGNYIIRPCARVLRIAGGGFVICETSTSTWTVGDQLEQAICPYPDVSGFQYHLAAWTPGGSYRDFMAVSNIGAREMENCFAITTGGEIGDTANGADQYGWSTGITVGGACRRGIVIFPCPEGALKFEGADDSGNKIVWGNKYLGPLTTNGGMVWQAVGSGPGGTLDFAGTSTPNNSDANNPVLRWNGIIQVRPDAPTISGEIHIAGSFDTITNVNRGFIRYRPGSIFTIGTEQLGTEINSDMAFEVGSVRKLRLGGGTFNPDYAEFFQPTVMKADVFANRPGSAPKGTIMSFTDSTTATWGATISGGGANSVLAWYNGTNWTVIGA